MVGEGVYTVDNLDPSASVPFRIFRNALNFECLDGLISPRPPTAA